jgi:hypothetical protein
MHRQHRKLPRKAAKNAGFNPENEPENPDKSGQIRVNPAKSGQKMKFQKIPGSDDTDQ